MSRHPAPWLGPTLALLGLLGVMLAGVWLPVVDDRPLKMSCYWSMHGAVATDVLMGVAGLGAMMAASRGEVRLAALFGAAAALMTLVMEHVLIPVMAMHVWPHRTAQDLVAGLALLAAVWGGWSARPEPRIDEALDALAAAAGQSGS
jgi:hypothetical protein